MWRRSVHHRRSVEQESANSNQSDMDKQRSTLRLSLEKHWMETSELKRDLLGKTTAISESEDALRRQFLKEDEGINEVKMLNVQIGSLHKKLEDAQTKAEAADKEIKRLQEEIREVKKEAENDMRSERTSTVLLPSNLRHLSRAK